MLIKFFKFNWPQNPYKNNTIKIPFDNKKLLVNISMNKKSSYVNELYSERVKAISYFEKKIPNIKWKYQQLHLLSVVNLFVVLNHSILAGLFVSVYYKRPKGHSQHIFIVKGENRKQ